MITATKHEFREQFREILLKVVEEGETIEITEKGEVIAHLVPASKPKQIGEKGDLAAWADLKRIALELAPYWPDKNIDPIEIMRDVRRDL